MIKMIGEGGQATVWSAQDRITKQNVAIKKFKKKDMDFKRLQNTYKERDIQASLNHQNILKERCYFENNNYACMVFDRMDKDVRDYMIDRNADDLPDEVRARELFKQMLQATAECHSKSIIHRDIKPDNFLLKTKIDSQTGEETHHIQLADFGISCVYDSEAPPTVKCGTMEYAAPEIIT